MKNNSAFLLAAVLGIAIGALSVGTYFTYKEKSHLLRSEYVDWRKLNLVLQQVDAHYVDSVDRKKVSDAAIAAALSSLDPHSVYMPPVERQESEDDLSGGFDGIGIQFNVPADTAVVIEVIPGGPSEKSGLLPGDRILQVDDKVIAGVNFPQDSMVRRMKGPAGTKVTITVGRAGERIPFEITRGKIPVHSVSAAFMANDTTAYLRLGKFSRTTAKEVRDALASLEKQGMKELIFDIRDNSGGYFDQALMVSDLFLPADSLVVYMQGRSRKREDFRSSGRGAYRDLPLKILVNEGSASSSEIFAGAMQDNHRAQIVGRRTFGKGLVQEPFDFTDGSGLRLTVARFYTPSGRCIQKPYSEDYDYEVLKRYSEGEMVEADSMKLSKGGILPDLFVPLDTTRATQFYIQCNRKATAMRFASNYFDMHRSEFESIDEYSELLTYFRTSGIEKAFLDYARRVDGLTPSGSEWADTKDYMLTQVYALVGRYSRLGDNAFYHIYLNIDDCYKAAIAQ
ncbi:MAG: S41 family peptidase, partial [Bacteroidales bacterium]|nr:S41 family peptidase [Candidatus Cryptobacteroides aphodequi]